MACHDVIAGIVADAMDLYLAARAALPVVTSIP
jgi:hypothetical protein